ncbi:MAG: nucleotidyltransferase domain-containing protein [Phycisphaerae bacterium]
MAQREVRKIIKYFEQCLKEKGIHSKIILFGSQANKTAMVDSDIDMVVISDDFRGKDIFKRVALIKEPEIRTIKKFMIPLDIITLTPAEYESERSLVAEYSQNGEVICSG